jgi:transcriptional regulator with PAS, ATPase and Fis domain
LKTVLQGNIPTLICGDTGVGKEPLAAILHHNSPQKAGPLVAINCAAIPADLLEAELFGIAHGTATGVRARRGKFLDAHGGSILLDEIGELTPPLQAKLLRVLQEREVTPVGGQPRKVIARIIASTNQNLQEAMRQGTLRRDLYYRLAGCVLEIPPLCQRPEDIPALLQHFLDRHTLELAKTLRGITLKALRALTDYPWPGNVRELDYEARRLALVCEDGQMIDSPLLSPQITRPTPNGKSRHPADR